MVLHLLYFISNKIWVLNKSNYLHNRLHMIYLVSNRFQADQTETKTSILTTLELIWPVGLLLDSLNQLMNEQF